MKTISILYKHVDGKSIDITLDDNDADILYNDICSACVKDIHVLNINGKGVRRFIKPGEIIDCMIIPVGHKNYLNEVK